MAREAEQSVSAADRPLPRAAGAIELTIVCLTSQGAPTVVAQALEALASLSHANLPGKLELLMAGSAGAAVAAMETHAAKAAVQAAGARMLANLTNGDLACKHGALDAGALRAVTEAMARHKDPNPLPLTPHPNPLTPYP